MCFLLAFSASFHFLEVVLVFINLHLFFMQRLIKKKTVVDMKSIYPVLNLLLLLFCDICGYLCKRSLYGNLPAFFRD